MTESRMKFRTGARSTDKKSMPRPISAMFAISIATAIATPAHAGQDDDYVANIISYVSGVENPEDLARVGDSAYAVVASFAPHDRTGGSFMLLDLETGRLQALKTVYPDANTGDESCAPPAEKTSVYAHGIDIRPTSDGGHELLAINHREQDNVEIYDIVTGGTPPEIRWKRCILVPPHVSANDISATEDGGFVVSSFGMKDDPDAYAKMQRGEPSGAVVRWRDGSGWAALSENTLSGPNGVAAHPNGKDIYVAAWGSGEIFTISLSDGAIRPIAAFDDFHPDNLTLAEDGALIVAGQAGTAQSIFDCAASPAMTCSTGGKIIRIAEIYSEPQILLSTGGRYGAVSTGLLANGDLWIGSFKESRLARYRIGGEGGVESTILEVTQSLLDAIAPGDRAQWETYLHEDFVRLDENGEMSERANFLNDIQPLPPGLKGRMEIEDFSVAEYGAAYVATYKIQEYLDYHGQPLRSRFRSMDVWKATSNGLKLIGQHVAAELKDPPAIKMSAADLCSYAGRYALTKTIATEIRCGDERGLQATRDDRPAVLYMPEAPDVFFAPGKPRTRRIFLRNDDGEIIAFVDRREGEDIRWERMEGR